MTNAPDYWKVLTTPMPRNQGLPHVHNVRIAYIKAATQTAISIDAYPDAPVTDIALDHIDVTANTAGSIRYANGVHFTDAALHIADGSHVEVEDSADVTGLP